MIVDAYPAAGIDVCQCLGRAGVAGAGEQALQWAPARRRTPRSRAPSVTRSQRLDPRRCDIAVVSSRSETSRMLRAASAAPPLCGSTGYSPARTYNHTDVTLVLFARLRR